MKVSSRIDGWLREAYFGQLLGDHPRAIQVFDQFPVVNPDGTFVYCLVLEYARHGDLSAYLFRTGKKWSERAVRREIAGILQIDEKTVKSRLFEARQRLRDALKDFRPA